MSHKPVLISELCLSLPHKVCFKNFTTQIHWGHRIGVIGRNGSGKSTLLKMLQGLVTQSKDEIHVPDDVIFGYLPQHIEEFESLSGAERLNEILTQVLGLDPNVLLLDEPTNHLDLRNRRSLMRMINNYRGTLIIVSHDSEVLRTCINTLWHIENEKIHIFSGNYDDYVRLLNTKRASLESEVARLDRQKKDTHRALMKEQVRAKNSRVRGEKKIEQRKWPTIVSGAKACRATETSGNKKMGILNKKQELLDQLSELSIPELIKPKFSLSSPSHHRKSVLSINKGEAGYDQMILTNISLNVGSGDRIAIVGDNGSGKSTLFKAIMNDPKITRAGHWIVPKASQIGCLDQHYLNLDAHKTALEIIEEASPLWKHTEIRQHLNDFLFSKNDEVNARVADLSGGEKARLSLAQIAAIGPCLLLLDEITNNLDMETREHILSV
ncbi:MAG: ATP-binding cassette domain-containing protein, partial [Alphaproteobacteria bacterium]|nr:ATP-binding cassette domain-containing protein [Alphaproteobacteria bacterium]